MPEHRQLVTLKKACEIAAISRRTIYNWIRDGKVETIRIASGHQRVYLDSLFNGSTEGLDARMSNLAEINRKRFKA